MNSATIKKQFPQGNIRPGTDCTHGIKFEYKIIMLFLIRALAHKIEFVLKSNQVGYGCWDDVIVEYYQEIEGIRQKKIVLLQAKHSESGTKEITLEQLSNEKKFKNGAFLLSKYFKDYNKIKANKESFNDCKVDLLIYTNMNLDIKLINTFVTINDELNKDLTFKLFNSSNNQNCKKLNKDKIKNSKLIQGLFDEIDKNTGLPANFNDVCEFILMLCYYLQQSHESELDSIIKKEFQILFQDDDHICNDVFDYVYKVVENMNKNNRHQITHNDHLFEIARETVIINKIKNVYQYELQKDPFNKIRFNDKYLQDTQKRLIHNSVTYISTDKNSMTLFKIITILNYNNHLKYIVLDIESLKHFVPDKTFCKKESKYNIIVIICDKEPSDCLTLFRFLKGVLIKNYQKKIIFITTEKEDWSIYFNDQKISTTSLPDVYEFNQFTDSTVKHILDKNVNFQGINILLGKLVKTSQKYKMTAQNIHEILENCLKIGPLLTNLKTIEYYITRSFYLQNIIKNNILLDKQCRDILCIVVKCLEDMDTDIFDVDIWFNSVYPVFDIKKYNIVIIPFVDERCVKNAFKEICSCDANLNYHLLNLIDKSKSKYDARLCWRETMGSKKCLFNYQKFNNAPEELEQFEEKDLIYECIKNKVIVIMSNTGMGKTCLINNLSYKIKEKYINSLVINLKINSITKELMEIKNMFPSNKSTSSNILKILLKTKNALEEKILLQQIEDLKKQTFILFDSLPLNFLHRKIVFKIIKILTNNPSIYIFISSRPSTLDEFKNEFSVVPYRLTTFSEDSQRNFFIMYYKSILLQHKNKNVRKLFNVVEYSDKIVEILNKSSNKVLVEIACIPLLTKMLADILLEGLTLYKDTKYVTHYLETKITSLMDLFMDFFETQCKIYFSEKCNRDLYNDAEKDEFVHNFKEKLKNHMLLSAYAYQIDENIPEKLLFSSNDLKDLDTIFETKTEVRIGIIIEMNRDSVVFVHNLYAEFLFALFLIEKIKENDEKLIIYLNIFTDRRWKVIRAFIENWLSGDFESIHFKNSILHINTNMKHSSLLVAAEEGNFNIACQALNTIIIHNPKTKTLQKFSSLIRKKIPSYLKIQNEDGENALQVAIISTSIYKFSIISLLCEQDYSKILINQRMFYKETTLSLAIKNCDISIVNLILRKGANIDGIDGYLALKAAVDINDKTIINLLIKNGVDINVTDKEKVPVLYTAILNQNIETIKLLITLGINLNHKDQYGFTALHTAARKVKYEINKLLIDNGIMINEQDKYGYTALHVVAEKGNSEILNLLLNNKADATIKDKSLNTALHLAIRSDNYFGYNCFNTLLDYNFDIINEQDKFGNTVLHTAVYKRKYHRIKLLLEYGADVNLTTKSGYTVLHYAAFKNDINIMKMLLPYCSNSLINKKKKKFGVTALDIVERNHTNNIALIKLLKKNGAIVEEL